MEYKDNSLARRKNIDKLIQKLIAEYPEEVKSQCVNLGFQFEDITPRPLENEKGQLLSPEDIQSDSRRYAKIMAVIKEMPDFIQCNF